MRGIRGWIRNLSDGLGPPATTVAVNSKPTVDGVELDLTTHRLGAISRAHVNGGSGSNTLADVQGHFGWDMELAPGAMNISVTPHDPQTEFRKRFPDESAQVGKAFLTDLERLGWAGGRDHLIWNAIFGGNNPTPASWSTNPTLSWSMGNGSIASFGTGGDAGKLTIRKFIAMLGGVPFTVELGDLVIPVTGDTAMPANASGTDRWDVICAAMDWNPASATYGKQKFEFTQGTPGGGIPAIVINGADDWRRLPLHAVKMAAGTGVYAAATDLRTWLTPPIGVLPPSISRWYQSTSVQTLDGTGNFSSTLNTDMGSSEIILPIGCAWDGYIEVSGIVAGVAGVSNLGAQLRVVPNSAGRVSAGDAPISGTNAITGPAIFPAIWSSSNVLQAPNSGVLWPTQFSQIFPLARIPAYNVDGPSALSRAWSRLRFALTYNVSGGSGLWEVREQQAAVHLWPVP